jgi:hypothetical protein
MVKRYDKTKTGEGGKGKKGRTVSDDTGGKSLSDRSTSAGVKSTVIHTSVNIFEVSKRDKTQYFVDILKDKRRTKNSELVNVQEDLYGNKLGMMKQEYKTRWSSKHNCGLSLMKTQENIQQFCVQERMTDVEGNHFKMGVGDWDIIFP